MKSQIDPSALYWASFERFELRIPGECALDCSHSGPCDADVARWVPRVRAQIAEDAFPNGPTPDMIRAELADHGAWDAEELTNDDANFARLIWIAACNVAEEPQPDCIEPVNA